MFFNTPGKPTPLKKAVYLCATTFLGVMLSFITHAIIEISYLRALARAGRLAVFYGGCALPPMLQTALLVLGIFGGFFLGRFWWRKLYVERVWARK
jgi:hypothetical protein